MEIVRETIDFGRKTYFNQSQIAPRIENGVLYIFSADGAHRSWGSPRARSSVTRCSVCGLIEIYVKWSHAYHWGSQSYYFADGRQYRANHHVVRDHLTDCAKVLQAQKGEQEHDEAS